MRKVVKPRSASFLVACLTFFALLSQTDCSFALSSVNVPLDHWSYAALDKLQGFGLIDSRIYNTKPYTRLEVARLVREALNSRPYLRRELPDLLNHLLRKFQHEFATELEEIGPSGVPTATFLKPVVEAQAKFVYVDGEPRRFTGFPREPNFGISATEGTPLLPNNEGRIFTEGANFSLQFASSARLMGIFSAYLEPIFIARQHSGDVFPANIDHFEVDLNKGYVKASPWNMELEVGRDSLWLGQGCRGTLLLSNNAAPLDMIKFTNPTPTILPWYFRYLGLVKYTVAFARLDDDRDFPNPWLGVFHGTIKPHPLFELGVTWSFMFNGEGAPSVDLLDILTLFRRGDAREKVNELASVNARLRLPFLRNAEIYGEFGGEDSTGPRWYEFLFRDVAYLLGIYLPTITCDGRTDLRVEYANNAFKRDVPEHVGFWYGHVFYRNGYTFDKMILGHPMGSDASDLFVRATHYITDKWLLGIDYDYMERGITLGSVVERVNAAGADLTYDFNNWLSLSARYSFGVVENFDMAAGDDRNSHMFMTGMKITF